MLKLSNHVRVTDSAFIGGLQLSVILTTTDDVHLDNIFVGDLKRRPKTSSNTAVVDMEGGIAFCSLTKNDKCPNTTV